MILPQALLQQINSKSFLRQAINFYAPSGILWRRLKKLMLFFASYRMEASPRRGDGFTQRDFALRNAIWLISDIMTDPFANQGRRKGFQAPISNDTPVAKDKMAFDSPHDATADIKKYHSSLEQIFAG